MILDVSIILIVAIFVFIGYKNGIIKTLYGLLSFILAGFLSNIIGKYLSVWIYNTFYYDSIKSSVDAVLLNINAGNEISDNDFFNNLPEGIKGLFGIFRINSDSIFDGIEITQRTLSEEIENIIMYSVVSVLQIIVSIFTFILILILLRLLSKYVLLIFKIPIIKQINCFTGAVFGSIEGLLICYIAILICRLFLSVSDQQIISQEMIDNSVFFNRIYYSEFFNLFLIKF